MWAFTKRHFSLRSGLAPDETLAALSSLLAKRGIESVRRGDGLFSVKVPIPLINWDRRLYSRDNWVGINPFIQIDSIAIMAGGDPDTSETRLDVEVSCVRSYVPPLFMVALAISTWSSGDAPAFAIGFFFVAAVVYYLLVFHGEIDRLIPAEIRRALGEPTAISL